MRRGLSNRVAEIVLLAEDLRQIRFIRRYLGRLGHDARNITAIPPPGGRGAGEQHVRARLAACVRDYRRQAARRSTGLVVMIDADIRTVNQRLDELREALSEAGEEQRSSIELIVLLIPRRNVETWIHCLTNHTVTETDDYKSLVTDDDIRPAARTLYEWTRKNAAIPITCTDSLRRALPELQRIPER